MGTCAAFAAEQGTGYREEVEYEKTYEDKEGTSELGFEMRIEEREVHDEE